MAHLLALILVCATGASTPAQTRPMALRGVVDTAMKQNRNLKRYLLAYLASRASYHAVAGKWDPVVGASATYQGSHYPAVKGQPFQTTRTSVAVGSVFVSKPLPTGGKVTLSAGLSRSDQTMRLQFSDTSPPMDKEIRAYKAMLMLTVEHPLLAGMGLRVNRAEVEQARLKMEADRFVYQAQAEALLRDVIKAYWTLVLAWNSWEIQQKSLEVLRSQEKLTASLVEVGKVPRVNLLAVRSEIAKREGEARRAWSAVVAASINLKNSLGMDLTDGPVVIRPTTPLPRDGFEPPKEFLVRVVRRSKELRAMMASLASMRKQLVAAENALLPRLDAKFRIGPAMTSDTFSDTVEGIFDNVDEAYEVEAGLTFTKPLGSALRSRLMALRYTERSISLQVEDLKARLVAAALLALDSLDSTRFRIDAARKAIALAQAHLDAERRRFEQGLSTNHSVLLRVQELDVARFQLLQALVEHAKTVVDIMALEGSLLKLYHVGAEVRLE